MFDYKDIWNKKHKDYFSGTIIYDDWLDHYSNIITQSKNRVVELGCGAGNNLLYLMEKGKEVIACDYSDEAINIINEHLPSVQTSQFDMTECLPIESDFTDLIIADLCLHYFSYQDTVNILNEIKRVLVNNGYLLFRVNSINDTNHGAMESKKIEKHYFEVEGIKKRFFDLDDLFDFFKDWEIVELSEEQMMRYEKPKVLWKGLVRNIKK